MERQHLLQVGLESWILVVLGVLSHARDLDVKQIYRDVLTLRFLGAVLDPRKAGDQKLPLLRELAQMGISSSANSRSNSSVLSVRIRSAIPFACAISPRSFEMQSAFACPTGQSQHALRRIARGGSNRTSTEHRDDQPAS